MFMFTSTDEINRRNSTNNGRRWYSDVFSIKGRDCYLYVDWYPGKNKNGEDLFNKLIPDPQNIKAKDIFSFCQTYQWVSLSITFFDYS